MPRTTLFWVLEPGVANFPQAAYFAAKAGIYALAVQCTRELTLGHRNLDYCARRVHEGDPKRMWRLCNRLASHVQVRTNIPERLYAHLFYEANCPHAAP